MGLQVPAPWGGFDLEEQLESWLVGLEVGFLGRLFFILFSHKETGCEESVTQMRKLKNAKGFESSPSLLKKHLQNHMNQ